MTLTSTILVAVARIFILIYLSSSSSLALAEPEQTVTGTVILAEKLAKEINPKGILFIFAKPFGKNQGGRPLAVQRIEHVKFPWKFSLSQADAMFPGAVFTGKVKVTARFSPDGDVSAKSGSLEGSFSGKNGVTVGQKQSITILIDKKL